MASFVSGTPQVSVSAISMSVQNSESIASASLHSDGRSQNITQAVSARRNNPDQFIHPVDVKSLRRSCITKAHVAPYDSFFDEEHDDDDPASALRTPASSITGASIRKTKSVSFSDVNHTRRTGSSFMTGTGNSSVRYNIYSTSSSSRLRTPAVRLAPGSGSGGGGGSGTDFRGSHIVSIVEGRGQAKGEVGLASFDLYHPELCLAQFSDTASYSKLRIKLQVLDPVEIIMPDKAIDKGGNMVALFNMLAYEFPETVLTQVHRRTFNGVNGLDAVKRLLLADCSRVPKGIETKYYCLAAAHALIEYVEFVQSVILSSGSVKITYKGLEDTCMIDPETARHLELIVSMDDVRNTAHSLFGVLNRVCTAGGARLLRSSILQPMTSVATLNQRLDAIEEMILDESAYSQLKKLVGRLLDVDRLVTLCVHVNRQETLRTAEYKLAQIIQLKHTLQLVPDLIEALGHFQNTLFVSYAKLLEDGRYAEILERINAVIHDDTAYVKGSYNFRTEKIFAVRSNLNALLDVTRRTYNELTDDITDLMVALAQEAQLPLRPGFSAARGFYLHMHIRDDMATPELPHGFINVSRQRNEFYCSTRTMQKYNDRLVQLSNEILLMSVMVVNELVANIRPLIGCLYNLTECISSIDMIVSLVSVCVAGDYVRPDFGEVYAVKKGRHPILDKLSKHPVVPNDSYVSQERSLIIITGPNMAGKSTYLKQNAMLQIMAQVGSFVPAAYCRVRICHQIFSRIGHNDDMERNSSAFALEMRDISYILRNLSDTSLIIVDELGRSTAHDEGFALSWAICEKLLMTKAFVFFATHFWDLSHLDSMYPNVENYHFAQQAFESTGGKQNLRLNHTMFKGPYSGPIYGFELVEMAGFPPQVVQLAKKRAQELHDQRRSHDSFNDPEYLIRRLTFRLGKKLQQIRNGWVDLQTPEEKEAVREYLRTLKADYVSRVEEVRRQQQQREDEDAATPLSQPAINDELTK